MKYLVLVLVIIAYETAPGTESADPREAIRQVALAYGGGWYEADAERMRSALHPELAKRMIYTDPRTGASRLSDMGAMTLVEKTRAGGGSRSPVKDRGSRVEILDVYENAAVAKVTGPEWVDYLHLARWNGRWVIVNVLWELSPEFRDRMEQKAGQ